MKMTVRAPLAAGILLAAQEQLRDAVLGLLTSAGIRRSMKGWDDPVLAWVDVGGFDYNKIDPDDDESDRVARVIVSKGATYAELAREMEAQINAWLKAQAADLTEAEQRWLQGFYFAGQPPLRPASF